MVNDKLSKLDRLEEEINHDILAASDEELLEEARADGEDPIAFTNSMREWLEGAKIAADKIRMREAREALERDRQRTADNVVPVRKPSGAERPHGYVPDTMAARNGKNLSERDRAAFDEDFDELFDDDAWDDDRDDKDK